MAVFSLTKMWVDVRRKAQVYSILITMKYWALFFLMLGVSCIFTTPLFAQTGEEVTGTDFVGVVDESAISIKMFPPAPQPNQSVTVEVSSLSMNLDGATISWTYNGKALESGMGKKRISTTIGPANTQTSIRAVVSLPTGARIVKSISVNPSFVDLVSNAESYTPPFYKGKAQFPYQGEVMIVAIPHLTKGGTRINPKNLIYSWILDGDPVTESSGLGKDSMKLIGGVIVRPSVVSVTVTSIDGTQRGTGNTTVAPTSPQITFYEESPLYGILFNRIVGNSIRLSSNEMWLRAVPYFFSSPTSYSASNLSYEWEINDNAVSTVSSGIVLRQPGKVTGTSHISLRVSNPEKILQTLSKTTNIYFSPTN
jgi:hypothetical protein